MNFQEYQEKARTTAIYPTMEGIATYPILGLCGEAGEVAEKLLKFSAPFSQRKEIVRELGDVLWYVANIAVDLNIIIDIDFNKFQQQERVFATYPGMGQFGSCPVLALCAVAGKVAEKCKKILRDNNGAMYDDTPTEIGWFLHRILAHLSNIAADLRVPFETVAQENLQKLADRYNRDAIKGEGDER